MTDPILQIEGLGKSFRMDRRGVDRPRLLDRFTRRAPAPAKPAGAFWALRDVSFEVAPGEVVGIVGRNGAGKSTLLKILARITEPTTGRAVLRGRVGALLEVGTGFHPDLTGRENVHLSGAILGMTRAEIDRCFDEIVAFAGVETFLDQPVKYYSSGMSMRLAFAVAAHLEPEVLVIDEVLAVGDAAFQKKCLGKVGEVSREGRTVLFVSHNLGATVSLCERCLLLEEGRLTRDGPAAEVVAAYQTSLAGGSTSSETRVDLGDVERYGTGRARFAWAEVRPVCDEVRPEPFVRTGEDLELALGIEAREAVKDANVAIVLYDSLGYRLIDANTLLQRGVLDLEPGQRATVTFRLRDLLLRPGTYLIGLWLGRTNAEDTDGITYAITLHVEPDFERVQHSSTFPGVYQCDFSHSIDVDVDEPDRRS